jgi:hypothetical protein
LQHQYVVAEALFDLRVGVLAACDCQPCVDEEEYVESLGFIEPQNIIEVVTF